MRLGNRSRGPADCLDGKPALGARNTTFLTATLEQLVPGPPADMSAVAYNLQYTRSLVTALVEQNPPASATTEVVSLHDRELVRVDVYGQHPEDPKRRLCVIGIGEEADRTTKAATGAWFDYHASVFFARKLGERGSFKVSIGYRVSGGSGPTRGNGRSRLRRGVHAAAGRGRVARNMPTHDECHVVQSGELMLMRVDLYGRDPLDSSRLVCLGGIADRHCRAMAAAEQAWATYHTSLLFAAAAVAWGVEFRLGDRMHVIERGDFDGLLTALARPGYTTSAPGSDSGDRLRRDHLR